MEKDYFCNLSSSCVDESSLYSSNKEISSISCEEYETLIDFLLKKNKFYNEMKLALKDKNKFKIDKIIEEWFSLMSNSLEIVLNKTVIL